jgi:hypothetical protein
MVAASLGFFASARWKADAASSHCRSPAWQLPSSNSASRCAGLSVSVRSKCVAASWKL